MAAGDLTTLANVKSYLNIIGKPISAITKANPVKLHAPIMVSLQAIRLGFQESTE